MKYNVEIKNSDNSYTTYSFFLPETGFVTYIGNSKDFFSTLWSPFCNKFIEGTLVINDEKIDFDSTNRIINTASLFNYIDRCSDLESELSIKDNLLLSLHARNYYSDIDNSLRIKEVLKMLKIEIYENIILEDLNNDLKQLVYLANAMLIEKKCLVINNINIQNNKLFLDRLKDLSKSTLIILGLPNEKVAEYYSNYIYEVKDDSIFSLELNKSESRSSNKSTILLKKEKEKNVFKSFKYMIFDIITLAFLITITLLFLFQGTKIIDGSSAEVYSSNTYKISTRETNDVSNDFSTVLKNEYAEEFYRLKKSRIGESVHSNTAIYESYYEPIDESLSDSLISGRMPLNASEAVITTIDLQNYNSNNDFIDYSIDNILGKRLFYDEYSNLTIVGVSIENECSTFVTYECYLNSLNYSCCDNKLFEIPYNSYSSYFSITDTNKIIVNGLLPNENECIAPISYTNQYYTTEIYGLSKTFLVVGHCSLSKTVIINYPFSNNTAISKYNLFTDKSLTVLSGDSNLNNNTCIASVFSGYSIGSSININKLSLRVIGLSNSNVNTLYVNRTLLLQISINEAKEIDTVIYTNNPVELSSTSGETLKDTGFSRTKYNGNYIPLMKDIFLSTMFYLTIYLFFEVNSKINKNYRIIKRKFFYKKKVFKSIFNETLKMYLVSEFVVLNLTFILGNLLCDDFNIYLTTINYFRIFMLVILSLGIPILLVGLFTHLKLNPYKKKICRKGE